MTDAAKNTDREIWRAIEGDYYSPSIHVTTSGGIGINVGGTVFVKPVQEWHRLALQSLPSPKEAMMANDRKCACGDESCHEGREAKMIRNDDYGFHCDPCIYDVVLALNVAGLKTVASCCGHGFMHGNVVLSDGREIMIARTYGEGREMDKIARVDINGDPISTLTASGGVSVKPLEWEELSSPREDGPAEPTGDIEAATMIGEYSVCFDTDEAVSDTPWCVWSPIENIGHFADFAEAKTAAQADYETRILSALQPPQAGEAFDFAYHTPKEGVPQQSTPHPASEQPVADNGAELEVVAWRVLWFDERVEFTDDKDMFRFNPQVPPRFDPLADHADASRVILNLTTKIDRIESELELWRTSSVSLHKYRLAHTRVKALEDALARHREGWTNVLELDLLPTQHRHTAEELRNHAHEALAQQGGQTNG